MMMTTMTEHKRLAFIGLGVMGYPMAGHLARQGHHLCVHNRTPAKAECFVAEHGGTMAATPRQAVVDANFVFACVGNDADVRAVTVGADGAFAGMQRDAIFIDHTTASAEIARELYAIARTHNLHFLDAPVSGGQAGAENGALTIMVGGDEAVYDRSKPLLAHFARAAARMGDAGAGQLTKMVNQICIAGLVQGLAEGLAFSVNAGLDGSKVFAALAQGAASSWQMINRHETMLNNEFDFGFAVDWMRKDLELCLREAKLNNSQLPVTKLVEQFYAEIQGRGGNRFDSSSLVTRLYRKDLP